MVGAILFKQNDNKSFKEVFPELPVIDINFALEIFLTSLDAFVKTLKVLFILTFLDLLNVPNLFTIAKEAPFLIASSANLLPSFFGPLIAKKISFFFIFLEFIDALFIFKFLFIKLKLHFSFKIFAFQFLNNLLFFKLISFKIFFLSEKIFFLPLYY